MFLEVISASESGEDSSSKPGTGADIRVPGAAPSTAAIASPAPAPALAKAAISRASVQKEVEAALCEVLPGAALGAEEPLMSAGET